MLCAASCYIAPRYIESLWRPIPHKIRTQARSPAATRVKFISLYHLRRLPAAVLPKHLWGWGCVGGTVSGCVCGWVVLGLAVGGGGGGGGGGVSCLKHKKYVFFDSLCWIFALCPFQDQQQNQHWPDRYSPPPWSAIFYVFHQWNPVQSIKTCVVNNNLHSHIYLKHV